MCQVGASWVRTHILDAHPNAEVHVFAIWMPMLAGDARSAIDQRMFDDPRVTTYWDGERLAGTWLADHGTGNIGTPGYPVWDAFFAFDGQARWSRRPTRLLTAGSPVIGSTSSLMVSAKRHLPAPTMTG